MATKPPLNPLAGPAGPGPYTTRPDLLRMGSTSYGEGIDTQNIIQGAPLSKTPDVRGATNTAVRQAAGQKAEKIAGLFDITDRPNEPITSGIDTGGGPGSSVLGAGPVVQQKLSDTLAQMLPYDQTGEIGILYQRALSRGM